LDRTAINHFSGLTAVSLVQFGQITGDLRLQLALLTLELRQAQMLAMRRYRLKLAAIDGHELPADQPHLATELDEGAAGRLKRSAVVIAKISNGLEIRCLSAQQTHHLDIAMALGFL